MVVGESSPNPGATRILFLSFYFQPDLSACAFRSTELVKALRNVANGRVQIEVLTTRPNRYATFQPKALPVEQAPGLTVRRFAVPRHTSGMIDQSRVFASYAYQVSRSVRHDCCDLVLATSSRLMTAVLGAWVSSRVGAPLYLDLRDIFVETMHELVESRLRRALLAPFQLLETYALRKARRVNLVSEAFADHFRRIVPEQNLRFFTNGVDDEFLGVSFAAAEVNPRPLIVCAGNIGQGQGLERIVPQAARLLDGEAEFLIVGDGGMRRSLERSLAEAGVRNVEIRPPVSRSELVEIYRQADCLFLHLNAHTAFQRVLPSKLFEYAATGKPILAGVAGYPRAFLQKWVPGVEIFDPCDAQAMAAAFRRLPKGLSCREEFVRRFARSRLARAMAEDILDLAAGGRV